MSQINHKKAELIYIGDPMCSWCYGFSPELDKIKDSFPDIKFTMVMGGLRAGGDEGMDELRGFLTEHWKEVEKTSGQKFNHAILKTKGFTYDTEPACKAVTLIRNLYPQSEYHFFKLLQKAFYVDNQSPLDVNTYLSIMEHLKLDTKVFHKEIFKDKAKDIVNADFQYSQNLGVTGFPTLIMKVENKYYRLTSGYAKAEKIINIMVDRGL
jgi:putative protein-disulfide isomerase